MCNCATIVGNPTSRWEIPVKFCPPFNDVFSFDDFTSCTITLLGCLAAMPGIGMKGEARIVQVMRYRFIEKIERDMTMVGY